MKLTVTIEKTPQMPSSKRVVSLIKAGVNRAAAGARTDLVRAVREEVPTLRASRARQDIIIVRGADPSAVVRVAERPMSLVELIRRVRPFKGRSGQPGGIRGSLGPRRPVEIPEAFIGPRGHLYVRRGKARLPIRRLSAPSVRDLAIGVWPRTRAQVSARLELEIRRALHRAGFAPIKG